MKRKTVSLCMIARDEEATIGMAMKSAMALVDEIVVVDTGSQDNTRIIAEGYGARVVDLRWQDDFAAARNAGLAEATGEWVLVLDADERLQPIRPVAFQGLLQAEEVAGYRVQVGQIHGGMTTSASEPLRLFRNHPEIRYRYPIHEQVTPALLDWAAGQGLAVREAPLVILQGGDPAQEGVERRDRNLRILARAIADHPEEPYFEYRLGCEGLAYLHEEVLPFAGLGLALCNLEKAWQKLLMLPAAERRALGYGPDMAARLAAGRLAQARPQEARQQVREAATHFGEVPHLRLQGIAAATRLLCDHTDELAPLERARLLTRARRDIHTLQAGPSVEPAGAEAERVQNLYPLRYLGELALLEGCVAEAAESFEKALTIDGSYSFAWLGLAECARFAGDRKRALKLYLRTVTENEWNHRAWLRGSSLMEDLGFRDNAASWRRKVTIVFPEHPSAGEPTGAATARALQPAFS
jgi:tetratricopeptide (TPR) repeat protein